MDIAAACLAVGPVAEPMLAVRVVESAIRAVRRIIDNGTLLTQVSAALETALRAIARLGHGGWPGSVGSASPMRATPTREAVGVAPDGRAGGARRNPAGKLAGDSGHAQGSQRRVRDGLGYGRRRQTRALRQRFRREPGADFDRCVRALSGWIGSYVRSAASPAPETPPDGSGAVGGEAEVAAAAAAEDTVEAESA